MRKYRVVIVGGAGVFGRRLASLVSSDEDFDLVVAGRDPVKTQRAARSLGAEAMVLDRSTATPEAFRRCAADAVVDASGPFTFGGSRPYALAEAALAIGANYIDIADGRDFVCGISTLDPIAQAANRFALSGASTTPALSSAVCDELVRGLSRVDGVEIGVSPGNRAPRGLAVVRSILSYAGKPVRVFRDGAWSRAPGWGLLVRRDIGPDLRGRWLSLCDTPDLELFPERYRVSDRVVFRGGLELGLLHLGLFATSQLVRIGMLPSLSMFSEMARDLADVAVSWGTDRGGMAVEVQGLDAEGREVARKWSLVAEGGDGPNIPILAAFACLKKMARIAPGARPCMGEVSLREFEDLFGRFRIQAQTS